MLLEVKNLLEKHKLEERKFSLILEQEFIKIMATFGNIVVPVNLSDIKNNFEIQSCQYDCIYCNNWKEPSKKELKTFSDLSLLMQAELIEKLKNISI